jgi:hypothetical protein
MTKRPEEHVKIWNLADEIMEKAKAIEGYLPKTLYKNKKLAIAEAKQIVTLAENLKTAMSQTVD